MIRALAVSLSGSEHVVVGGVKERQSYRWGSEGEARAHLERIGWSHIRFQVDEKTTGVGTTVIVWDNQSKTEHAADWSSYTYLKGEPPVGKKLSKSDLNQ